MKTTAFWDVAPCSLVEVDRLSEVRIASVIRAIIIAVMMKCSLMRGCPGMKTAATSNNCF
jgi:hypothetical protein